MIRVLVPSMPTADELLPYLREMDRSKVYVNGGPMVCRLEQDLQAMVGNPCVAVSNGTVSLELALRALDLPPGAEVLVPAVTYVASAQAIVNAGLVPVICDVDATTWQLDPGLASEIVAGTANKSIRAVMPVAAFGSPVPVEPWERFTAATGLPVLIDAAGAIYGQQASAAPGIIVSYSLHATKALGCGEGGVVSTSDRMLLERVRSMSCFGPGGTNAKLSEYHAAVGLASMGLSKARATEWNSDPAYTWRWLLSKTYARSLPAGIGQQARIPTDYPTLLPILLPESAHADTVGEWMMNAGIETRAWYRPFLDERPEFHGFAKLGPLSTTAMLRQRLLGLPWHAELTEADVDYVCETLDRCLQ